MTFEPGFSLKCRRENAVHSQAAAGQTRVSKIDLKSAMISSGSSRPLQSVSPQWYFEQNDKCGMTGSGSRDTARYMDILFKNVVTSPANVASKGLKAFEENEDIETPELLIREIERFLRPGKKSGSGAAASDKK